MPDDWAHISRECARSIAPKGSASLLRSGQAKGKDYIAVKTSHTETRGEAETSRTAEMEEFGMSEFVSDAVPGMVILDDVYDTICEYEELYQSHIEARKGKRYRDDVYCFPTGWKKTLLSFKTS